MIAAVNNDSHIRIVPAGNRLTVRIAAEVVHKERTLDARDEVSSKETNALNQDISAKPQFEGIMCARTAPLYLCPR
jgi:hypothetical protein